MPDQNLDSNNQGTLEVGSFIGGTYRVLDFIGQGGMGFVYKVEHLMMAKILALKVLRSEQVSEDVWKRFRIEAQAIARLDHANVVRIYDMSQTEAGLPYYTMDLLVGESLADYLDEYYRLPVSEALGIFRQVCAGLAYAHDRGIIHRDIKPGNIMLLADGKANAPPVVKIVDFGIAKLSSFDSGFGQGLTRPGEVFGSPLYMSPEQCSGQQLDHRTDMYSVGVTMFQALTGRPPLLGKTAIETTAMHQSVVPPSMADVIVLDDDEEPIVFPPELEQIVARLLAKSPDARYDSLADVASELLALERGEIRRARQGGQGGLTTVADAVGNSGMAPYAVAEAARRRASYAKTQVLTGGQTDTDSGLVSNNQAKSLVIIMVAVIAALGLLATTAFFISRETHVKKTATVFTKPIADTAGTNQVLSAVEKLEKNSTKEPPEISPAQAAAIKSYVDSHSGYYSSTKVVGGKKVYVFEFPTSFDLGLLAHRTDVFPYAKREVAKGTIVMPTNESLRLSVSRAVIAYPELLKGFRPNELVEVCFNDSKERTNKLFPILKTFPNLSRLEIRGCEIDASDIAALDKLAVLDQLCVDNSTFSTAALAHSKILRRLRLLGASAVPDVALLLKKLSESNKLDVIEIDSAKLGTLECQYIGKMTNLLNLTLKNNPVTDKDIEYFLALKKLKTLDLSVCNNLTEKAADTLVQMKGLEELRVPEVLLTPECEKRVRKALPKLKSFE
jgi:tRNA A-37 threonylcarbamoyl transferase component Bud32